MGIRFADRRICGIVVSGVAFICDVLRREKAGVSGRRRDAAFAQMIDGIFGHDSDDCPHCILRAEVVTTCFRLTKVNILLGCPNCSMIVSQAPLRREPFWLPKILRRFTSGLTS